VVVARFLKELRTDYLDLLLLHCVTSPDWPGELRRQMEILTKLKAQGKIRALGVSCHFLMALEAAVNEPWVESVHARINPYGMSMDDKPEKVVPVLKKLHAAGKGEKVLLLRIETSPEDLRDWIVTAAEGKFPDTRLEIRSERCNHCDRPPCVACCPTGASHVEPYGRVVLVTAEQCIGCKACLASCPYDARFIHPDGYADTLLDHDRHGHSDLNPDFAAHPEQPARLVEPGRHRGGAILIARILALAGARDQLDGAIGVYIGFEFTHCVAFIARNVTRYRY